MATFCSISVLLAALKAYRFLIKVKIKILKNILVGGEEQEKLLLIFQQ